MREHFRTLLGSSAILGFALVAVCPSAGSAIPLLPETTSGTAELNLHGGFTTIISGEDRIFVGGVPLTSSGPTSAFISWPFIDNLNVSVTHAGQHYSTCNTAFRPCAWSSEFLLGMATAAPMPPPPPLTAADFHLTVPGTYGLRVSASVFLVDPTQNFGFDSFQRSGPAAITLQWFPGYGNWQFESGFAEIDPTPEPTTLLLFATSAAGLGLARWLRRGRQHAA